MHGEPKQDWTKVEADARKDLPQNLQKIWGRLQMQLDLEGVRNVLKDIVIAYAKEKRPEKETDAQYRELWKEGKNIAQVIVSDFAGRKKNVDRLKRMVDEVDFYLGLDMLTQDTIGIIVRRINELERQRRTES